MTFSLGVKVKGYHLLRKRSRDFLRPARAGVGGGTAAGLGEHDGSDGGTDHRLGGKGKRMSIFFQCVLATAVHG